MGGEEVKIASTDNFVKELYFNGEGKLRESWRGVCIREVLFIFDGRYYNMFLC